LGFNKDSDMEALYYKHNRNKTVCYLCPHECKLAEGKTGICRVRSNFANKLISENYGILSSMNFDPIEKKPLYHYYPGRQILSIGSFGCNMHCDWCQNWSISQTIVKNKDSSRLYDPVDVINIALSHYNLGIAYTYNEPVVWYEFMLDTARLATSKGLKNVMVTNAYINEKPLDALLEFIDAFNVDLKSFSDSTYRHLTGASLAPVMRSLKQISASGKHLEITCLVIPGVNDSITDFKEMIKWISSELGNKTVLHLSRYFPAYRNDSDCTSAEKLKELYLLAKERLSYVYVGNINMGTYGNTYCPDCNSLVIKRQRYTVDAGGLSPEGNCKFCGYSIARM